MVRLSDSGVPEKKQQIMDIFTKGFEYYLEQNWETAIKYFEQAKMIDSMDGPTLTYLLRCNRFMQNPPPNDWDGVFTMETK